MATKADKELAYEAGRAVMSEPPERRKVDACPFSPLDHPEERAEWLAGFSDALEEQEDLSAVKAALKEARKDA